MIRILLGAAVSVALMSCGTSDRVELVAVASTTTAAPGPVVPERDPLPTREPPTTRASRGVHREERQATTTGSNTTRPLPRTAPSEKSGTRTVSSTAYCETGTMANGQRTYDGAVAMNGVPMGSRWHVLSGPYAGRTLTVGDRIGHGSSFDIAMPGRCEAARQYGRRQITIERVG